MQSPSSKEIRDRVMGNFRLCWNPECSQAFPLTTKICTKCGWTATGSKITKAAVVEEVKVRAKTEPKERKINKTEQKYGSHLEVQKKAGQIHDYKFEALKFRLADECTYTPDFMVILKDGSVKMIDVKAFWKKANKPGITEDSLVKMKVVGEQFPMFSFFATWEKDGVWEEREF
jgi:hypothetical protein